MIKKKIIVAIDCGKANLKIRANVKANNGEYSLTYPNRCSIDEQIDEGLLTNNTYNVIYEENKYAVGENAKGLDTQEGKASEHHIVCTLTALTNYLEPNEVRKITLVYGESVDKYFSEEQKKSIKKQLEGHHTIVVNNNLYDFYIEYVHILPEGIGHILMDLENYGGLQYVVDIGGGTMQFLEVVDGIPTKDMSISERLGFNKIHENVRRLLKVGNDSIGKGTFNLSNALIDTFIKEGHPSNKFINDCINKVVNDNFKEMDSILSKNNIDIHEILKVFPITFIGGTSGLLKKHINRYYGDNALVLENCLTCNVDGFYAYAEAQFGGE